MNEKFLSSAQGQKLQKRYRALKEEIAAMDWLTNGSVTPNHPGNWRWTTKVKSKTVTLTLTQEQAVLFKQAIKNHRRLEAIVRQMRLISREVLIKSTVNLTQTSAPAAHPKRAIS